MWRTIGIAAFLVFDGVLLGVMMEEVLMMPWRAAVRTIRTCWQP